MASNNALNQTSPNFTVNQITINNAPVAGTDGTNKTYVDMIAAGFNFKNTCFAGTTGALTATYANGAAGVGATLTNAGVMAAFSVDGQSPSVNARILVKDQGSTFQNGIYTLTTVGSGASNWVLTRATDYDTIAEIQPGDIVAIQNGTVNADTLWLQTDTVAVIGTDPIQFTKFLGNGIQTLAGDSGSATGLTVTVTGTQGLVFTGSGATLTESFNYLDLPVATTGGNGTIKANSAVILNTYSNGGTQNLFLGYNTGRLAAGNTGSNNFALGVDSFSGTTSGNDNIAIGRGALQNVTTGGQNTGIGLFALQSASALTGNDNTALGTAAGQNVTSGADNTYLGKNAGINMRSGSSNTAVGINAMAAGGAGSANDNVAVGNFAVGAITTGSTNVGVGGSALNNITTATGNIALGYQAGTNLTAANSNNIEIGNAGVNGDSGVIRIGTNGTHTSTLIQGIYGSSVSAGTATTVVIDSTGLLGTSPAPVSSISITGDTGGALTGNSFTFHGGTTGLSFGGAGTTETLTFAGITANAGVVSLGTDATDNAINIGTAASAGRTTTIGNATGTSSVAINCGTGGVTVGTSATAHTTTIGSTNSTSATTVQSGSGALNVTSTNGALTINSGTGALGISTDASATTVSFATGGAVKTVTLGSTNTTSATSIKSGSGNVAINSGLTIDSSGRNYNTVQPAFSAYLNTTQNNVTGDGTTATIIADVELFDQGSNYDNTTGVFTAPITGRYFFNAATQNTDVVAQTSAFIQLTATSHNFVTNLFNPAPIIVSNQTGLQVSAFINMTAGDTCRAQVTYGGSTKTVDIAGNSYFAGHLVC